MSKQTILLANEYSNILLKIIISLAASVLYWCHTHQLLNTLFEIYLV